MSINKERAQEILSSFIGKKLLVVGDIFLDHYVFGKVERLNPEAPVPILHAQREQDATGGAGNTAKNAAMLGSSVSCIGLTGNDVMADTLEATAKTEGYVPVLVRSSAVPTIVKKRFIVRSQQLLRVDYEEDLAPDADTEEALIKEIVEKSKGVDGIIVSDYAKGTITERVAAAIMNAAQLYGVPVMVDAKPSRVPYFTGAAYMSPNRKEAHEYLGLNMHENGGKSPEELAGMISSSFDTSVFLTLSADGMYVHEKGGSGQAIPTRYIRDDEVVDTSGCGDTAAAVILLAMLSGSTATEAAELGNAAGATVARKTGSVGATSEEILHTISDHHA